MESPAAKRFFLYRWVDYTATAGGVLAAACLGIVTCIVTYEVIMRYVFNSPTYWVGELSIYLCMGVGFLGAAYALKNDSHFSITIIIDRLSPKNRHRMRLLTNTMGLAYCLVFIYKGAGMAHVAYIINDRSSGAMDMPLWIIWLLVPVGGTLLSLQFLKKLVEDVAVSIRQ